MNYQDMSDFEINCEVLRIFHPDIEYMCMSESGEYFYHCGPDGNGFYQIDVTDFCKSWADAGPIAEEYKIAVAPYKKGDGYIWHAFGPGDVNYVQIYDREPCRAICIAFLMMKGGE